MAYDLLLADKVRACLATVQDIVIEEKKMFRGLAFLVNGKMCVNISGQNLMCRFDASQTEVLAKKKGFLPMVMKGKVYKGYCYVEPAGIKNKKELEFWINCCLNFNSKAKASKKRNKE
jgi:TfoX/Sxy family transcriptional regulator of competence genes